MKKNKIFYFILFIFCLLLLTGCKNNKTEEEYTRTKIMHELDYLDTQIISMLNKLNNISFRNFNITSEEINMRRESAEDDTSSSSGNSSSERGESGEQKKESSSQTRSSTSNDKSNITITQMDAKNILDLNENDIDWNSIKSEIETISDSWGIIILDLSTLNVDSNTILGFSSTLDKCILSIKDENKIDSLTNIATLYSFIPEFEKAISATNSVQNIKQVKSYIINAYSIVEKGDWFSIEENIAGVEKTFKNVINDIEYMKDKEYKVNKTYVLIKELQNSLINKDKKIFYIKYKNLMSSISTL